MSTPVDDNTQNDIEDEDAFDLDEWAEDEEERCYGWDDELWDNGLPNGESVHTRQNSCWWCGSFLDENGSCWNPVCDLAVQYQQNDEEDETS